MIYIANINTDQTYQHSVLISSTRGISNPNCILLHFANVTIQLLKKLINNSRGKYKRNECLINVCKSDTDLS